MYSNDNSRTGRGIISHSMYVVGSLQQVHFSWIPCQLLTLGFCVWGKYRKNAQGGTSVPQESK